MTTVAVADLRTALTKLATVIEGRAGIPILTHVLLVADGNLLTMVGSDLDVELLVEVSARGEGQWTATADHRTLVRAAKLLTGDVALSFEGGKVRLSGGGREVAMVSLTATDFPRVKPPTDGVTLTVDAGALKRLLLSVKPAISTEETRYYLNGAYLHTPPAGGLRAVATDGHRLLWRDEEYPQDAPRLAGTIIPHKTVNVLLAVLAGTVSGAVAALGLRLAGPGYTVTSKAIDGTFPDYLRVIPAAAANRLSVQRTETMKVAGDLQSFAGQHSSPVRLGLGDELSMRSKNFDAAEASAVLFGSYEGLPLEIGLNAKYLREMLAVIEGDTVQFYLGTAAEPVLINAPGSAVSGVLMPLRV